MIEAHERAEVERKRVTIDDARANAGRSRVRRVHRGGADLHRRAHLRHDRPRRPVAEHIDWTPFFHAWGLRGRYPAILDDATLGEAARPLCDDAQRMLDRIISEHWFAPQAVVGFWQAER